MFPAIGYAIVPVSGTVSNIIGIARTKRVGVLVPTITSGQIYAQVGAALDNATPTSANMVRAFDATSGAAFFANVGPGSLGILVTAVINGFTHMRIETQNAQAAARTFQIVMND